MVKECRLSAPVKDVFENEARIPHGKARELSPSLEVLKDLTVWAARPRAGTKGWQHSSG